MGLGSDKNPQTQVEVLLILQGDLFCLYIIFSV